MFAAVSLPSVGFSLISFVTRMISRLGWTASLVLGGVIIFAVIRSAVNFFKSSEKDNAKSDYRKARSDYYYNKRYHRYASRRSSARLAYRYRKRYYRYYRHK